MRNGGTGRRGPVYDDAMKMLAEDDLAALLSVLPVTADAVTAPVRPVRLDGELAASAVRADLLVRLPGLIMHGEYVKDLTRDLPLRMVEYRLRIRRRHPDVRIVQFVLVLQDGVDVPGRFDDPDGVLSARWTVLRVSDLDRERLLASPTTAPLAVLVGGNAAQRAANLTEASNVIAGTQDPRRGRLLAAAATLASIALPVPIIEAALQEATMPVPIRDTPLARELYREGLEQGLEQGHEQGVEQGRAEGERLAVVRLTALLLRRRFGDDPRIDELASRLAALGEDRRLDLIAAAPDVDALAAQL